MLSSTIGFRHVSRVCTSSILLERLLTPIAKKSVKARLPSQAAVNGSLSFEVICFKWAIGPARMANPSMKRRLPILKATANLRGLTARRGRVRKATRKHTAAPAQHNRKPRKRSQRLSQNIHQKGDSVTRRRKRTIRQSRPLLRSYARWTVRGRNPIDLASWTV